MKFTKGRIHKLLGQIHQTMKHGKKKKSLHETRHHNKYSHSKTFRHPSHHSFLKNKTRKHKGGTKKNENEKENPSENDFEEFLKTLDSPSSSLNNDTNTLLDELEEVIPMPNETEIDSDLDSDSGSDSDSDQQSQSDSDTGSDSESDLENDNNDDDDEDDEDESDFEYDIGSDIPFTPIDNRINSGFEQEINEEKEKDDEEEEEEEKDKDKEKDENKLPTKITQSLQKYLEALLDEKEKEKDDETIDESQEPTSHTYLIQFTNALHTFVEDTIEKKLHSSSNPS